MTCSTPTCSIWLKFLSDQDYLKIFKCVIGNLESYFSKQVYIISIKILILCVILDHLSTWLGCPDLTWLGGVGGLGVVGGGQWG